MSASLVGSEMCIRDRCCVGACVYVRAWNAPRNAQRGHRALAHAAPTMDSALRARGIPYMRN
eukprot:14748730-Alexandrium_andersonii.AAC.1